MRRHLLTWTLMLAACAENGVSPPGEVGPQRVRLRQPVEVPVATAEFGEDCAANGRSACKTGHCIETRVEGTKKFHCTTPCTSDGDCPETWVCTSLLPAPDSSFCTPPLSWTAQPTQARALVAAEEEAAP